MLRTKQIWNTGVIYWPRAMFLKSMLVTGHSVGDILFENNFNIQGHCDPEFWPCDTKTNRGHLLTKANCSFEVWWPTVILLPSFWSEPSGIQTDRPTNIYQSNIFPFLEGQHQKHYLVKMHVTAIFGSNKTKFIISSDMKWPQI